MDALTHRRCAGSDTPDEAIAVLFDDLKSHFCFTRTHSCQREPCLSICLLRSLYAALSSYLQLLPRLLCKGALD